MNAHLSKILKISEKFFYIRPIFSESQLIRFDYGPFGHLLHNNIFNEWLNRCVTTRDENVFPFYSTHNTDSFFDDLKKPYADAKIISCGHLPFSIVFPKIPFQQNIDTICQNEKKYFRPKHVSMLKSSTFTSAEEGRRYFHYWLRQRKIWWRKFSANPARISISECKNESEFLESAQIQACFPWGNEQIETVRSYTSDIFNKLSATDQEIWKVKPGKRNVFPCVIESVTNLEMASMYYICDAYSNDARINTKQSNEVMKFHRKLAPYKIAIVINSNGQSNDDLIHLGEFLLLNLKKSGITSLFLRENDSMSIEAQYEYYDILGVPYLVVLVEESLKDGIFGLRCRETTLHEQLHTSQLTDYIKQIMFSY